MDINRRVVQKLMEKTSPLNDQSAGKLASALVRVKLKKNAALEQEDDTNDRIYYVGKGLVRQYIYKKGKDLTEHFAPEGTIFMNIESYLLHEPTSLRVEALEPAVLFGIPHDSLMELADDYPDIEVMYRKLMELMLVRMQEKFDFFRLETAKERYTHLMKERPDLFQRAPLRCIASYLLMTRETLSRIRKDAVMCKKI